MKRNAAVFLVFLCSVLVFSSALWAAEKPIKLLCIYPVSGPMKGNGDQWMLGIKFAAHEINEQGGLLGRKVEVIVEDSQMKPDVAVSKAQKYLLAGNADIVISTVSSIVAPLQDLTKEHNIPFVMFAMADAETGKNFAYNSARLTWNCSMIARTLINYTAKNTSYKKFYLLNQDYSYGRDFGAAVKREIARQIPGAQIVGEDYHPLMSKDLSPFLSKIKTSGAEAIVTLNWGIDISVLLKQRLELGVKAVVIAPAVSDESVVRENSEGAFGNISADTWFLTVNTKESRDFINNYKKWYKGTEYPEPTKLSAREYIGMKLFFAGIKKAGSLDVNKLMPALEGLRTSGPTGEVSMRACDHQILLPLPAGTVTSKKHPYMGVPTIIPANAVAIEEEAIDNPRCKKK